MWRAFAPLLVLASCCVLISGKEHESAPEDVIFCELARNPNAYSGKRIRIRAVYSYMFEVSRLKSPTCCSERGESIWVDFDDDLHGKSKRLFKSFPKGMGVVLAVFVGTIETGKVYGTFGERVRLVVDQIDRVEEKAKPSAGQSPTWPTWVPQNCEGETGRSPGSASRPCGDQFQVTANPVYQIEVESDRRRTREDMELREGGDQQLVKKYDN